MHVQFDLKTKMTILFLYAVRDIMAVRAKRLYTYLYFVFDICVCVLYIMVREALI